MPWVKGQSGNLKGRPKNAEADALRKALSVAAKKNKITFLQKFVNDAYSDSSMAIVLFKKLVPDKLDLDVDTEGLVIKLVSYKDADTATT